MEQELPLIFSEDPQLADPYRQAYNDGLNAYIARLNREGKEKRTEFMPPAAYAADPESFRRKYWEMIGLDKLYPWDAAAGKAPRPEVTGRKWLAGEDQNCLIYRIVIDLQPEIPMYAVLVVPKAASAGHPVPLIIGQHGGGGTPELSLDYYGKNNYSGMSQRAIKRGAAILAPQLLLWNVKDEIATMRKHPIPHDRSALDRSLKRYGMSVTALEISGIMKLVDFVADTPELDLNRLGMIGLSYGGFFTMTTMAADTRIRNAYSGCGFNDRDFHGCGDWYFQNSGLEFEAAEIAGLCAPRKLYISVGKVDPVFDYRPALPEAERVKKYYEAAGVPENFIFSAWEGAHTCESGDEGYELLFDF